MQKFLCTLAALWIFSFAMAQVGSLDSEFGTNGIKGIDGTGVPYSQLVKSYPADDGGRYDIFTESYDYFGFTVVAKYLSDGSLDVTYGNSGYSAQLPIIYAGSVRQQDGRIVIAGSTEGEWDGIHIDAQITRLNTNGAIDKTQHIGNIGTGYEYIQSIHLQGNNVLVTGKSQSVYLGTYFFAVVWYADGRDRTVASDMFYNYNYNYDDGDAFYYYETFNNDDAFTIALEGKQVVVQGPLHYQDNTTYQDNHTFHDFVIHYATVRYNTDGSPDQSFGTNGELPVGGYTFPSFTDDAYTPKMTNGRKVVLAPVVNPANGTTDFQISVFRDNGSADTGFGQNGTVLLDFGGTDVPKAYVWQGNQLIVGGNSTLSGSEATRFALARFNRDGSLDTTFNGTGQQLTAVDGYHVDLKRLQLQHEGSHNRILAVGDAFIAGYRLEDAVTLTSPEAQTVATDPGVCSAVVKELDPVLSPAIRARVEYELTGATTGNGTGSVGGLRFNKGMTTVRYTLAVDPTQTGTFTVRVEDREPPVISNVSTAKTSLWPANHKMVDLEVDYTLKDNCGATAHLSVESNEPQTSADAGDAASDWEVVDAHHIRLRAERLGTGNGRTYTITITAVDAAGNESRQTLAVDVPKNQGKSNAAVVGDAALNLVVMPNPSTDRFTINVQSLSDVPLTLRVFDSFGRMIEQRTGQTAGTLQVGGTYRPGIYHLEVRQGAERVQVKLVKLGL